jgi:hypothetical protein
MYLAKQAGRNRVGVATRTGHAENRLVLAHPEPAAPRAG